MGGDLHAERVRAKMRDLAEKIDGGLGVGTLEFAVGGAHAAERGNPAVGADSLALVFGMTNLFEPAIPTFSE